MNEEQRIVRIGFAILFAWGVACGVAGWYLNDAFEEPKVLTTTERRNIAIDFVHQYPEWRYVLANSPMDGRVK